MAAIEAGTYRGTAEGLTFEFRVENGLDGAAPLVSGDISRGTDFVGSFLCTEPALGDDGRTLTGPLQFRGNPDLFAGSLTLSTDERGTGTFQVGVDMEGGFRDLFAGRVDWQGSFLRRLTIEIDGIPGTEPPVGYDSRGGDRMTLQRAFEQVGYDVNIVIDSFPRRGPGANTMRGFTLAEIHAAMQENRSQVPADRLHVHVLVCGYLAGRGNRGVLGVMYDFDEHDLNRRPREGVAVFYDHPLLSDPRYSVQLRQREYVFTLIHEIGHALNLLHSFDKARPASLSWMNYPDMYPRGYEAGQGYDGTPEFWRRFEERFDEEELRHLRHASPREILAGGFAFGTYEEGVSLPFGGPANPRRTRLGANPLRTTRAVELQAEPVKSEYDLGEPVFLRLEVRNIGPDAVHVPDALDPSEGYVRILIRTPNGQMIRYRPPVSLCKQAQRVHLPPEGRIPAFDGLPLFLSSQGPLFTEPGTYQIMAEMTGIDGSRNAYSPAVRLLVRPPNTKTERIAYELWDRPEALQALYLRHPLAARAAFNEAEELLARAELPRENTTRSYLNYVAALGWMTPFSVPRVREKGADLDRAAERMQQVNPRGLPESVARRRQAVLRAQAGAPAAEQAQAPQAVVARTSLVVTRPMERARAEISPAGLFGGIGLSEETRAAPDGPLDPFVRVVPRLRGSRRFADVVSWNIENLYSPGNVARIPRVAELIRSFRCDFWGLQEVGRTALARVTETLNSGGQTRFQFAVVDRPGQQSGALFRTDTTRVEQLPIPDGYFTEEIDVLMTNGQTVPRRVFLRLPLLCDVRVRQSDSEMFDFRCAIVHLKSTDPDFQDRGEGMRLAAARELVRWIEADRAAGVERDYLIMGDMNAETARQGLEAFTQSEALKLLSVGMRDRHGPEALTRVASGRLLDHIVITNDASAAMPAEDEGEQIIVRIDTGLSDFTTELSDHVPVAVRFVLGEDED